MGTVFGFPVSDSEHFHMMIDDGIYYGTAKISISKCYGSVVSVLVLNTFKNRSTIDIMLCDVIGHKSENKVIIFVYVYK